MKQDETPRPLETASRSVSIVVPVYNSAATLGPLVNRLQPVLKEVAEDFELILVNDGSQDSSWVVASDLASENDWVRSIDLMRNYGQHNALLCGIRAARFAVVITMDDDLQNPPEEIPKLLTELAAGHDVVYGTPVTEQHGRYRNLASIATKFVLHHSMGASTARKISAFRAFRQPLRDAFAGYHSQYVSIDVLLTWGTVRFSQVPVSHQPRKEGRSNYTIAKLFTHTLNMVTGFSTLPLRIASLVGFAFTFFGILVLAYAVGRYLLQDAQVPGFAFLASVIAIFSGAQLFALGIIGEYLARMHFRMMELPAYTIRTTMD